MKIKSSKTVLNVLHKETTQSVLIEMEEDCEFWCLVTHDGETLSMSLDNLKILQNQINDALQKISK